MKIAEFNHGPTTHFAKTFVAYNWHTGEYREVQDGKRPAGYGWDAPVETDREELTYFLNN